MSGALTRLYPMVQFKKDTWEIDEFDCASMFLLIGSERALLIDCGMGIGDLRGAVEMLTDKPVTVVLSHGHVDHTGNARQFPEVWLHPADQGCHIPEALSWRKGDVEHIARRQKDCIGSPYTMFHLYPYDIEVDLREPTEPMPIVRDLTDGMEFDLGGGRIVTAYHCPGHTAGEMVFLDRAARTLIAGDALNYNLGVGAAPLQTTLKALRRIRDMAGEYDGIYNGHHDFRALGAPLDDDCLPTVIDMCERVVHTGEYIPCQVPSFWGQHVPLTRACAGESGDIFAKFGKRVLLHQGRNFLSIDPDNIRE